MSDGHSAFFYNATISTTVYLSHFFTTFAIIK